MRRPSMVVHARFNLRIISVISKTLLFYTSILYSTLVTCLFIYYYQNESQTLVTQGKNFKKLHSRPFRFSSRHILVQRARTPRQQWPASSKTACPRSRRAHGYGAGARARARCRRERRPRHAPRQRHPPHARRWHESPAPAARRVRDADPDPDSRRRPPAPPQVAGVLTWIDRPSVTVARLMCHVSSWSWVVRRRCAAQRTSVVRLA
jgi:hypothetical protein